MEPARCCSLHRFGGNYPVRAKRPPCTWLCCAYPQTRASVLALALPLSRNFRPALGFSYAQDSVPAVMRAQAALAFRTDSDIGV